MPNDTNLDDLKYAQGPATKILPGSDEAQKDADGVTKPNLHRRIDEDIDAQSQTIIGDGETTVFDIDAEDYLYVISITVNGSLIHDYTVDHINKTITFNIAPTSTSPVVVSYINLHDGKTAPDQYSLLVGGTDSFRCVKYTYHDEDSTTSEIP